MPQALLAQQGWPWPPHATHELIALHTMFTPHDWPGAMHVWFCALQQPVVQLLFAQQGWLGPPQPAHLPVLRHTSPVEQVEPWPTHTLEPASQQPPVQLSPGQQGVPGMPQAMHVLLEQVVLAAVQVLLAQQAVPAAPQAMHWLLEHSVLAAEQLPPQQLWPRAPQLAHAPFMQAPKFWPQLCPLVTQVPALFPIAPMQQPPFAHWLPAQHGSPLAPQWAQVPPPAPVQMVDGAVQVRPRQQASPALPHSTQLPLMHWVPF